MGLGINVRSHRHLPMDLAFNRIFTRLQHEAVSSTALSAFDVLFRIKSQ